MTLLQTAKEYRSYGWSIIPIRAMEKRPSVEWKKYQTEYATDEELSKWFEGKTQEDVGIGIVTGKLSNIVVIDLDSYKEGAPELELNTPVRVRSGGGGTHGYFKYREGVKNSVGKVKKATDVRGEGGYAVLPPSKHPNGKYYEWIEKDVANIPELPEELVSTWEEVKEPLKIEEFFDKESGERNDSLYRASCSLLNKHDEVEAWNLVVALNNTYKPPLTDREVQTIFNSALNFIKKDFPVDSKLHEGDSLLVGEPVSWSKIKGDEQKRVWLWENFLAKGSSTLFSSLAKAGKTTLLRCLFVAMHNEEEFAGQPTKKCNILILSEESAAEWADGREGLDDEEIKHVHIWPRPTRGIPSAKEWITIIDEISKACTELKIDLVVIDTISTFWPVEDENDAARVKRALVPLYKLTDDNGVALMLVHHFKKDGGTQGTASRGSGALAGHVDNIIEFRRNEDGYENQRKIKTMGRFIQETEIIIELNNQGKYETKGEPWVVSKQARMNKIISLIKETGRSMSVPEITLLWNSRLNKISERTIRRYVTELADCGQCYVDKVETVRSQNTPFYLPTGWEEANLFTADNKNTPTTGAVRSGDFVRSAVRTSSEISLTTADRTATVVTGGEIVRSEHYRSENTGNEENYGSEKIIKYDDEDTGKN